MKRDFERVDRLDCAGKDIPGIDDWPDEWLREQFESFPRVVVDDYKVAGHPDDTLRTYVVIPPELEADEQEIDRLSLEAVAGQLEREAG